VAGGVAAEGLDQLGHRAHPRGAFVAHVPDECELGPIAEYPGKLAKRPVAVEPMERLSRDPRVGRTVSEGQILRHGVDGLDVGRAHDERRSHRGHGFDAEDPNAGRRQHARELPGARTQLDDGLPRSEGEPVGQERHGLGGEVGATAFVGVGGTLEADAGRRVDDSVRHER
jgi:hypothetical protein